MISDALAGDGVKLVWLDGLLIDGEASAKNKAIYEVFTLQYT